MKKFRHCLFMGMVGMALLGSGCNSDNEEVEPVIPALELEKNSLSVSDNGGNFSIPYSIRNGIEGVLPTLSVAGEVDWVSGFEVDEHAVAFDVARNKSEKERACKVSVSYPGLEAGIDITLTQSGAVDKEVILELKHVDATSITVDVVPSDKNMTYFLMLEQAQTLIDYGMTTDELIYESDVRWIKKSLEVGVPIEDLVSVGDQIGLTYRGCLPETEYVLYAYGLDITDYSMLTDLVKINITTGEIELVDVGFDIQTHVEGSTLTVDVTPQAGYDGLYYVDAYEKPSLDFGLGLGQTLYEICYYSFESTLEFYQYVLGIPLEDALNMLALSGPGSREFTERKGGMTYVVVAFSLTDEGIVNSEPTTVEVKMESTEPESSNILTISVSDVEARSAILNVTTTNDDPYILLELDPVAFEGLTDDQIMEYILSMYYWGQDRSGSFTEELTGLHPETQYTYYGFGVKNDQPTTRLFTCSFTTSEMIYSDVTIEVKWDKYYDVLDIIALEPSYQETLYGDVLIPVSVVSVPEGCKFYFGIFDKTNYKDDVACMDYLVGYGKTEESTYLNAYYDIEYEIRGFAVDQDGTWGRLVKFPASFKKENVSDAQEFIDSQKS